MDARLRYYNFMGAVIYEADYAFLLFQKYNRIRRAIEMLIAVCSCSALALWFINNDHLVWYASIIALAQVITTAVPHLDYSKREDAFKLASHEIQPLKRKMEKVWFDIERHKLSDDEIEAMIHEFTLEDAVVFDKVMGLAQPDHNAISHKARKRRDEYMKNTFG